MEPANRIARRSSRLRRFVRSDPIFAGTALISFIAMLVAVPIGLMSAVYLAEYAHPGFARSRSRFSRFWPASRRWSTASSPPLRSHRSFAIAGALAGFIDLVGKRARGRCGDGHNDHPFYIVPLRRRDHRRAASHARRVLWPWRHTVRNHTACNFTGRPAGIVGSVLWRYRVPSVRP